MLGIKPYNTRVSVYLGLAATACTLLAAHGAPGENTPIKLDVDATDAPRNILHARLQIPVQPGKLTLVYPKWLPGDHAPTGPITELVGLKMSAAGQPVEWHRDLVDMYAFELEVPAGASSLDVALDYLSPTGRAVPTPSRPTPRNWPTSLGTPCCFTPRAPKPSDLQFAADAAPADRLEVRHRAHARRASRRC